MTTPVIACSAREDVRDATWRDAGCNALLTKPFSKDDLFGMIARWANQQVAFVAPQADFTVRRERGGGGGKGGKEVGRVV